MIGKKKGKYYCCWIVSSSPQFSVDTFWGQTPGCAFYCCFLKAFWYRTAPPRAVYISSEKHQTSEIWKQPHVEINAFNAPKTVLNNLLKCLFLIFGQSLGISLLSFCNTAPFVRNTWEAPTFIHLIFQPTELAKRSIFYFWSIWAFIRISASGIFIWVTLAYFDF